MAEVDKIKRRVFHLLQKTTDNGCTEDEAMAAAEKAGELMEQFDLSITDVMIREMTCKEVGVNAFGRNRPSWDTVVVGLGHFCDCRIWFSKGVRGENSKFKAFGLPQDVEVFEYLYHVIATAIMSETDKFKKSEVYKTAQKNRRAKTATTSFQQGMAGSISRRLAKMKRDRTIEAERTGRSLVVVKEAKIDEELKARGMRFKKVTKYRSNYHSSANSAGQAAGNRVNLNNAVKGKGATALIG